jgi:hypothetical protein
MKPLAHSLSFFLLSNRIEKREKREERKERERERERARGIS